MTEIILINIFMIFIGFSSGAVVSGGVFAFINAMGIIPRMAIRTKTKAYGKFYEDVIVLGGLFATIINLFVIELKIPNFIISVFALCVGMFMGMLAVALAEVLNVIPIIMRRNRMTKGLPWLVLSISIGKMVGSLVYFLVDGFFEL